jgi:isoquinoline 1-oxidoreductase beta subunit
MGQGTLTSLPLILAEEMDADWSRCRVEQSPSLGDVYGDPTFLNMIFTVESRSVRNYYDRLRMFGCQARQVLMLNAAEKWQIPVDRLRTNEGVILHPDNKQRLSYGEIASFARQPDALPELTEADLKPVSDFRLIGKVSERRDVPAKVDGSLRYSIDITLPNMVYAAVTRAPIVGVNIRHVKENGAGDMPGVLGIMRRERQVAVVAESYFEALKAREKIEVSWTKTGRPVDNYDSTEAIAINARTARDISIPGLSWDRQGDVATQFADARMVFESEYRTDYMYHGGIEPLNAVVWVKQDGESAEVWAGTQAPAYTVQKVAEETGVKLENIKLHRCLLGGGFGRRSVNSMDFVEDAAWISGELRQPVKVIWDRHDDIGNGHFRSLSAHFLRAAVDNQGRIQAWHHRVACEDPLKHFEPLLYKNWNGIPLIAMTGAEHANFDGSALAPAYDLNKRLVEYVEVEAGIRVYAMRGVGSLPNTFAIESFLDELAERYQRDPIDLRLELLHRSQRAQTVLKTVAEMAGWTRLRKTERGTGLAYGLHGGALVASIVEISVDKQSGQINVHDVWICADVGIVIQPENVKAQLQGAAIYGLSNALMESITIKQGVVQQSNFHNYRMMRMSETPKIHVRLMTNDQRPGGVGELGAIVTPAALANAFARLTNVRLHHMPFTMERVRKVLAS